MSMEFIKSLLDVLMIVSPNIGFVAQILKFRQVKSSEGFSKLLSLILLIANILRIFFWIGKQFSIVLLYQSILSIIMQIILLRECLRLSPEFAEHYKKTDKQTFSFSALKQKDNIYKHISIYNMKNFWNWPYLINYIFILSSFTVVLLILSHTIGFNNKTYIELLGMLSAGIEACIGIPQVISNYNNKNTETISLVMLITWALGDSFKSIYFFKTSAPFQLLLCGVFQLFIDFVLVGQLILYSKNNLEFDILIKNDDIDNMLDLEEEEEGINIAV